MPTKLSLLLTEELATNGNCSGMDTNLFFSEIYAVYKQAITICHNCPVKTPCLEYALAHKLEGIWGGTTHRQRRQIARKGYSTAHQLTTY